MMYRLVLQKSLTVTGVRCGSHISRVSSDRVWICDIDNLILTNTAGDKLHHLTDIYSNTGVHTVTRDGDLIYIDSHGNINKLSTDHRVKTTLIQYNTAPWRPQCVYSSPSTGDLLVGIRNTDTKTGKVNRYNNTGQHIQTIQHDNNTGQGLYSRPIYITENHNGDVIVSDRYRNAVVVTDRVGRCRFSYTGPPSGSRLYPQGICTDALSHILVCDYNTYTVHMIDKDGQFLSQIETRQHGIDTPWGLSYDDRTHLLWIGSYIDNTVNIYRLNYGDSLTALSLEKMKCVKHPRGTLSQFCIPCETALCEMCFRTSSDHIKHDVKDVEKLFREIHKRKDGDAVLMCLLLCQNYKISLEEKEWIEKYNAVAEDFKFKKIKKQSDLSKIKKYKPVLKQDGPGVIFSCEFFKHTSFLRFAKDPKFMDFFLTWARKDNTAEYCRTWAYPKKEGEVFCWLPSQQTEQLIEKLGEDIFTHPTWQDTSIHEAVFRNLGIPMQVIMRGDDSVKNFLENLKKGKTTMYHATGMLIGCGGSGKTTLLGRLKGIDVKDILNNTRSTRGIDIQSDVFDVSDTIKVNSSDQKQRIKVRFKETSQHQRVPELHEEISNKMKSLDIDDPGDNEEDTASKAANDKDMSHDSTNTETESLKGDEAAAPLFEKTEEKVEETQTVAKNSESWGILRVSRQVLDEPEKKISMVDFAGQCSYYSSHQIFLSPRAFFILVLNMEKNFDEMVGEEVCSQERSIYKGWTHRDYLTFWTKSIHQYSSEKAPVLLVGTHAEEKTEQEKAEFFREIWKALKTKTNTLQGHLDKTRGFAIGFHENEGIEKIKLSIVDVVQKLDHWGEMLPHSWAMFENFFQEKKYLKIINKRILLAFNEVLPKEIKLETVEDINTMLQFFHDIREILYFNQEFLREVIILDVQWFADAFKNVITDKNHAKEDLLEFTSEWDQFDDTGELSDTLLSRIWKMNNNEYLEHKDDIMLYMEKLGLLAKIDGKKWYVPCMNKTPFPIGAFASYPASSILCYTFDVLPAGIFHRLVAICMQNTSKIFSFEDRGCIYQTAAKFMYQDRHHNVLIGMTQTEIQLQVFVVEGDVDVSKCHQIREILESVLHDLSNTFQENSEFRVAFKCKPAGFCDNRESAVLSESEFSQATFQCPSCKQKNIHVINTRDITKYWKQEQQQKNLDEERRLLSPVDSLERRPTDKELMMVSGQIGAIFQIGIGLGLDNATIQQIRIDYQNHGVKIQVFQILCEWKRKEGGQASVKKLLAAIKEFKDEVDFERIENVFNM
ncbi:uncharacterized protein LOC133180701 [Saccostrea echinata]|uniref:uncharacterized protein LOC133180701 n=1 Tax=Saccostrea echinata TaxID=191078 RepID=UPI002A83B133|nr:uncharacterized protein LOC133180701 [Saccostrea echinata]